MDKKQLVQLFDNLDINKEENVLDKALKVAVYESVEQKLIINDVSGSYLAWLAINAVIKGNLEVLRNLAAQYTELFVQEVNEGGRTHSLREVLFIEAARQGRIEVFEYLKEEIQNEHSELLSASIIYRGVRATVVAMALCTAADNISDYIGAEKGEEDFVQRPFQREQGRLTIFKYLLEYDSYILSRHHY
ncbi:hypothetical protein ACH42_17440 [Endozoicomonas sp. (ex Bugula neritina AB1)]|nr:hypothetical protein ACH42_17440 [Endozoicomonas sp. (ex Bugula neritina AB1)]